jgi:hypothetical protein
MTVNYLSQPLCQLSWSTLHLEWFCRRWYWHNSNKAVNKLKLINSVYFVVLFTSLMELPSMLEVPFLQEKMSRNSLHFPCLKHVHIILIILLTEICRDNEHTTGKHCIMSLIICTLYQIKLGWSNQWAAEMGLVRGTNGRERECIQCVGGESWQRAIAWKKYVEMGIWH